MMTDRLDATKPEPLQVMLAYGPLGLVRATARELRLDGMTVDTGAIMLTEQAEVEISFTHKRQNEFVTHRIKAQVTASSRHETRLTFRSYARTTFMVLQRLVQGQRDEPRLDFIRRMPRLPASWLSYRTHTLSPGGRL